jgi:hypothetical protein
VGRRNLHDSKDSGASRHSTKGGLLSKLQRNSTICRRWVVPSTAINCCRNGQLIYSSSEWRPCLCHSSVGLFQFIESDWIDWTRMNTTCKEIDYEFKKKTTSFLWRKCGYCRRGHLPSRAPLNLEAVLDWMYVGEKLRRQFLYTIIIRRPEFPHDGCH